MVSEGKDVTFKQGIYMDIYIDILSLMAKVPCWEWLGVWGHCPTLASTVWGRTGLLMWMPGTPRRLTKPNIVFSSWWRKMSSSTALRPSLSLSPPLRTQHQMTSFSKLSSLQMMNKSILKLSAMHPATYAIVSLRLIIHARLRTRQRSHSDCKWSFDLISSSRIAKNNSTKTESSLIMVDVRSGSYHISTAAVTVHKVVNASSCCTFLPSSYPLQYQQWWCLDVCHDIDDLLEMWYTGKCDVLAGYTSIVECVQCHLCCRFANWLGR